MAVTMRQLRYLTAIDATGSFGGAARAVHVSQPALSAQIKELEAHLGVELIERQPRGARLTRAGREAVALARRILAETEDLERLGRRPGVNGRLSLGVLPTVAPYLLADLLRNLQARQPDLDIRILEARTETLAAQVEEGGLDAAVVALPVPNWTRGATPLFEDRFVLARGPEIGEPSMVVASALRPEMIEPDQLLLLADGHCLADQALAVCRLPARSAIALGASSLCTLSALVAAGLGVTLLPEISLPNETAAQPGLVVERFSGEEPARQLGLIHRQSEAGMDWLNTLAETAARTGEDMVATVRTRFPI